MKIIKRSITPGEHKRVICKKCQAILELDSNDIIEESDPLGLESGEYHYYKCPCCFSINSIS